MKLIAFSYAGGDGHVFNKMKQDLKSLGIEVIPYMYRGRNLRSDEGFYSSIEDISSEAADYVEKNIGSGNYMLIGHSMGSLVAYECFYEIRRRNLKLPDRVIFSGLLPPDELDQVRFSCNDEETLISQLSDLGGLPEEILKIPEFREYFLPIIKNDIQIFSHYRKKERPRISVGVTVLSGSSDYANRQRLTGWKRHSLNEPDFIEIEGNHFFLFKNDIYYSDIFRKICRSKGA